MSEMRQRKYRIFYGVCGQENTYFHREFTFGEIENGCHWDNTLLRDYSIIGEGDWTGLKDKQAFG